MLLYVISGEAHLIAQWIHLQLSTFHPGSNPNHTIYAFSIFILEIDAILVIEL